MFQDVLGRLNGKSETQLVTDRKLRTQLRGSNFVEQRWGRLHFVSGGFLVGDELQALPDDASSNVSHEEPSEVQDPAISIIPRGDEQARSSTIKPKKHKRPRCDTAVKKHDSGELGIRQQRETQSPPQTRDRTELKQDKKQRKADKAARKLERQIKRHKKHALQVQEPAAHNLIPLRSDNSEPVGKVGATRGNTAKEPKVSSTEAKIFPVVGGSRQAVRQRYIQQKKLSMMDSKALNEVSVWPGCYPFHVRSLIVSLDTDDKGLIGTECEPLLIQKSQLAGLRYRFCVIKMCRTMRASPLSPYLRNVQINGISQPIDGSLRRKGDDWIISRREFQVCLGPSSMLSAHQYH